MCAKSSLSPFLYEIDMKERENIINNLKKFFKENREKYSLEMVFLYGSWAKGFPREDSDIDIGIVFQDNTLSDDELFRIITDISLCLLHDVNLEVNIVPIYPDFRKPMLYYNIIIFGTPLYIRDYNKYIDIKNEAIYQMEDFSIFGINWQLKAARKNMKEITNARI
jgi:predicted nucleotidyltransferase